MISGCVIGITPSRYHFFWNLLKLWRSHLLTLFSFHNLLTWPVTPFYRHNFLTFPVELQDWWSVGDWMKLNLSVSFRRIYKRRTYLCCLMRIVAVAIRLPFTHHKFVLSIILAVRIVEYVCGKRMKFSPYFFKNSICIQGDAGSPLIVNGIQVGIYSMRDGPCGELPKIYTQVSYYREWIRQVTGV